jgi:TusA-related sulfurtransferase
MELIRNIKMAQVGDVIAVVSSDEGSKKDIPAWAAKARHEFVGMEPADGATRFIVRKAR